MKKLRRFVGASDRLLGRDEARSIVPAQAADVAVNPDRPAMWRVAQSRVEKAFRQERLSDIWSPNCVR
jgi:hypothetical protein